MFTEAHDLLRGPAETYTDEIMGLAPAGEA
jgi:hypothetical protein